MARKTQKLTRAEEPRLKVITLGLEPDLISELDEVAKAESRSRARQAAVFLRQGIREWRQQQERKQSAKAALVPTGHVIRRSA
jgi:metal-responsive CopG/Arc/MetJ family transcriptional regulator